MPLNGKVNKNRVTSRTQQSESPDVPLLAEFSKRMKIFVQMGDCALKVCLVSRVRICAVFAPVAQLGMHVDAPLQARRDVHV